MNSSEVVKLINEGCNNDHPYKHIADAILESIQEYMHVSFRHILREGSTVVDAFAKNGLGREYGIFFLC